MRKFFWLTVLSGFLGSSHALSDPSKEHPITTQAKRYESLETFTKAVHFIEKMYIDPEQVSLPQLTSSALEGIVSKLDPHSAILPPEAFKQLTQDTSGRMGGIGISISVNPNETHSMRISGVTTDSPAAKAGIEVGDEIVAINGIPYQKLGTEALKVLHGEPGTKLELTLSRASRPNPFTVAMKRVLIRISSVKGDILSDGFYLVRLSIFQEDSSLELRKFLESRPGNIKGVILDLRDNPGGLLEEAGKVVDLFIESGLIVSTVGRDKDKIERMFAHKVGTLPNFPMVVLINEGTASASEIAAGALQDHERALIMGNTSFGKGSVQTLVALPDGSGLKLTIATYYTPKDRSIQARGIQPDIVVDKATASAASAITPTKQRKEADLEGHLVGNDLSDLAKQTGLQKTVDQWPKDLKADRQVVAAFTYLSGWNTFRR